MKSQAVWIIYPGGGCMMVPSLVSLVTGLAERGFSVVLFLEPGPSDYLPVFDHSHIKVISLSRATSISPIKRLASVFSVWIWRLICARAYSRPLCVIPVDWWGLFLTMFALPLTGRCVLYLNLEIRILTEMIGQVSWSKLMFKRFEAYANRQCRATIMQDDMRAAVITREHRLGPQPMLLLPNAPLGTAQRNPSTYLRDQFAIKSSRTIILYVGTLTPHLFPIELMQAAVSWPSNYALIIHSPMAKIDDPYVREIINLIDSAPDRCFFSNRFLNASTLDKLISSADIGVCLCKPVPGNEINEIMMGQSSGKVALYLKAGLPVVASDLESLSWIESAGCGALIDGPGKFLNAVERILANYSIFATAAVHAFNSQLSVDPFLDRIAGFIKCSKN